VLTKLGKTDTKLSGVEGNIETLIDRVIKQSRRVEKDALTETLRDEMLKKLSILSARRDTISVRTVVESLRGKFSFSDILKELIQLQKQKIIKLPSHVERTSDLRPITPIQVRQ